MSPEKTVRPFSAGYFIVDAEVLTHTGERAIVPVDYYGELTNYVTRPLLKTGGEHFWAYPERGVPSDTVALPDGARERDEGEDPVLLAKDNTAYRLVTAGEQPRPA